MNALERYYCLELAQRITTLRDMRTSLDWDAKPRALAGAIEKAVEQWLAEDRLPSTAHFFEGDVR